MFNKGAEAALVVDTGEEGNGNGGCGRRKGARTGPYGVACRCGLARWPAGPRAALFVDSGPGSCPGPGSTTTARPQRKPCPLFHDHCRLRPPKRPDPRLAHRPPTCPRPSPAPAPPPAPHLMYTQCVSSHSGSRLRPTVRVRKEQLATLTTA